MEEETISVNGKEYRIDELNQEVQTMIRLHKKWNADLIELHEQCYQVQLSLESLSNAIVTAVSASDSANDAT